jgi:hypothetical protein
MLHAASLLFALASTLTPVGEDGASWIGKAESRLYRWQKPGTVVCFDLKTDVLEGPIAAMERDLVKKPDREGDQFVRALKHIVVHGRVDTSTGAVETDIVIDCDTKNPQGKAAVEKMKRVLGEFVKLAFDGLPFKDPSLVGRGSSVVGAEIQGDSVVVTLGSGKPGEEATLHIDRRSTLPTYMDTPAARLEYAYTEVIPGHFAPTKLGVQPKKGPSSTAEYSYQTLGNVVFPQSIRLDQGGKSSRLTFESVRIEARGR